MSLRLWVSALVLFLVVAILGVVSGAGADTTSPNYGTSLGHSISSAENTKTVTEDEYNAIKTMQYINYFGSFLLPGYSAGYSSSEKSVTKDSDWNKVIIGWSEAFLGIYAPGLHAGKFYWILDHPTWPGSYGVIPPEYQSSSGSSSVKQNPSFPLTLQRTPLLPPPTSDASSNEGSGVSDIGEPLIGDNNFKAPTEAEFPNPCDPDLPCI